MLVVTRLCFVEAVFDAMQRTEISQQMITLANLGGFHVYIPICPAIGGISLYCTFFIYYIQEWKECLPIHLMEVINPFSASVPLAKARTLFAPAKLQVPHSFLLANDHG